MHVLQLQNYTLAPRGAGDGIENAAFTLDEGDVCAVESTHPDDAQLFLKALATLIRPLEGVYIFRGRSHDLKNYNAMLACKKKIGYVARDAALISNLSIRQNLLLQRQYNENQIDIDLDAKVLALCDDFGLIEKLDKRPSELNTMEIQAAIVIRELTKRAEMMLLSQPEDFIGHAKYELLVTLFNTLIEERLPIVLLSYDQRLLEGFANRRVTISNGSLRVENIEGEAQAE